jgi:hypothetical protein
MSTYAHVIPLLLTVAWLLNLAAVVVLAAWLGLEYRRTRTVAPLPVIALLLAVVAVLMQIGYWLGAWD